MEVHEFDKYQALGYDSMIILARAILLDKVSIVRGRITVDELPTPEEK